MKDKKLNSTDILHIIHNDRKEMYGYDDNGYEKPESWYDLHTMGLSDKAIRKLGEIRVASNNAVYDDWEEVRELVWAFLDHDVYLKGTIGAGSYGTHYKLHDWTLKEVKPRKVEIFVYE